MPPFGQDVAAGLTIHFLNEAERLDANVVHAKVSELRPDVIVIAGWANKAYRSLAFSPAFASIPFIMGMDTPWKGTWRQGLARFKLARYLQRMSRVVVAGERSWQYARHLGVPETRLSRGYYGFDYDAFAPVYERRLKQPGGWPRRFLFMGRYVPEKGVDTLLAAYDRYRGNVIDPWTLTCHGRGPLCTRIAAANGVEEGGFVQPRQQPDVFAAHGAFILASRYEPWGVVIAEALASGMPVICTEACGASVELVRSHFNGLIIPTENIDGLSYAFAWAQEHWARLPEMGCRGRSLAAAFGADAWAERWKAILDSVR